MSIILEPFWSYKEAAVNDFTSFEVQANILLFIPIGFLLPTFVKRKPLLWGVGISVFIEIIQLITLRGTCETDDVISNTIGMLIGYCAFIVCKGIIDVLRHEIVKRMKRR